MYLIDTNILSEGAPAASSRSMFADLVAWMDRASRSLWLSVVTIAEIEAGIERSRLRGEVRKAAGLAAWLETVEHLYADRILPFDREVAHEAGRLSARARMAGASPGFADAAIAATARTRGMIVITRNVKHFEPFGVGFVDPYTSDLNSMTIEG